jgi:erythromycin esterase
MRRLLLPLVLAACAPRLPPATAQRLHDSAAVFAPEGPASPPGELAALAAVAGAARVLALGQPGPGSHELPRLIHRLFRHLSEQSGFTGLALAADGTAALRLDAYVQGAAQDLDAALLGLGDRDLATVELRELLSWARERNALGGQPPLRVFGLDPRDPEAAAAIVLAYLERVDPQYVPKARSLLGADSPLGAEAVLARLDEGRAAQVAAGDARGWALARQQAELVAQARRMSESWEFEAGEFARARNVEWALGQLGPQGKLLVWTDNLGVAAQVPGPAPSMGDFLRQWLGADYRAIAVTFTTGSLLVPRDAEDVCVAPLEPPRPGSLDAALAGPGLTLVDLRGPADPALRRPQRLRGLSGVRAEDHRLRPAIAFDAILNFPTVGPAAPISAGAHAAVHATGPCYTLHAAPPVPGR